MANELVLIVEDDDKNRKLMRDVLACKGYRLAAAETGEDGVRLAREPHPDLIFSGDQRDHGVPTDPRRSRDPAVAVTAPAVTQDRKTIRAAGFDGYQSKPLNVKAFVEAVREMLDRPGCLEAPA